ncbi:MAG: hypothetical protein WCX98_02655 [Candidatus Dojkabacteria bacterium]
MDEKKIKSLVLFLMMGIVVISVILYVFVASPASRKKTLGISNLSLELPVQNKDLRYAQEGIIPFCSNDNKALTLEVTPNISVYSATQGTVYEITNNKVVIEALSDIYIEYEPLININVKDGEYVTTNTVLGFTMEDFFSFRLKNDRSKIYECPYIYLSPFGKTIVDQATEIVGLEGDVCECVLLKY